MDNAELGFAVSSPILRLAEGVRTIKVYCVLLNSLQINSANNDFLFSISTEDGWYDVDADQKSIKEKGEYEFTVILKDTDPAMINYDQKMHLGDYRSENPILRILVRHHEEDGTFGYSKWKNVVIKELDLSVDVKGLRSLIIQNDLTTLDPSKPFSPFGSIPTVGNHLYIGHQEVFKNKLQTASYKIKWKDVPNSNLGDHYDYYDGNITNSSFKVDTEILDNKVWYSMEKNVKLFPETDARKLLNIDLNVEAISGFKRKIKDSEIKEWDYKSNYGFTRLTLATPDSNLFQGFGHTVYAKTVMRNNADLSKNPNQPYTPIIESISMDYSTKVTFSESEIDQFYHVEPFGQKTIELNNSLNPANIIAQHQEEGALYFGLDQVEPPQSVSLLIQMIEGSGDANQSQINSNVSWYYLSGNDWQPIDRLRISHDSTRNLLNTGVIRFDLKSDIDTAHTIMPEGLFWLKAIIPEKSAGIDRIQNVHVQAIEAIEVDASLNDQVIKPESIAKLFDGSKGISSVNQQYASFDGALPETEEIFYARVSERLRHKNRGVNIWDYERLVLDEFPELYKVKCLNHTNYKTEVAAGHVMIAVIPNLRNKDSKSPFQPKLSMNNRMDIYDHLREIITPFIYLRVENPIYEPIKLSFNVGFHEGYDEGFYGKKLHTQLQEYLSPWAFESETNETTDLVFGG
ncbi:MAG: baseplate J/gp47 family protein, partial [Crocinitomicaceae bacterium]|nr:baseplate J/gp47 family protein [Crocinitomicaceae bacterium]